MKRATAFIMVGILIVLFVGGSFAATGDLKLPPFKDVKLPNGLTLLLMEKHQVPMISFCFIIGVGSASDPAGKEGLASVTSGLLRKGTKTRSADQFSSELDFIGGQFFASTNADYTVGRAEFMKKDVRKGLVLLSDVLINPIFPADEVSKLLKQRIDGIKAAKDRAQGVIGEYFNAYLYGSHPYGKPVGGHETSLAAIKPENVTAFYQQNYAPTSVILAAVGDFATTEMESMLGEAFGAWKGKPAPQVQLNDPPTIARNRLLLVDKPDSTQTFFRIGSIGISATNPDRFYIEVVNTLFGGRFTSMLNTELRIKSGLTYGANSFFDRRRLPGPFAMASYTKNASTEQALDLTLDVLKRLREKGITEEELASAKAFIQGQFPPEIETSDQLGELLTRLKYFGLGASEVDDYFSKINAMTLADAQRIIKQYFPLDNLVFVLIGKDSEIRNIAKKYAGQLDSKSITHAGF